MAQAVQAHSATEGLSFKALPGDAAALLAFDVDESLREQLAGFAVEYTTPKGDSHTVGNRLNFTDPVVAETTPEQRRAIWTASTEAPLQKFHWVHYPSSVPPGEFTYKATAMLFKDGSETDVEPGPETSLQVDLSPPTYPNFELGFTRGYLSSQAYHDHYQNADIVPPKQTIDYETKAFLPQYEWLGLDARRLVFDFLAEVEADEDLALDVFAYDLNEPDVLRAFAKLGSRLRILLDDSKSHVEPHKDGTLPLEQDAKKLLIGSAGADNVKTGHFKRFSHSKVLIQRRGDKATKVLAGSANFSVRGLYVQSNNVFVFHDEEAAGRYEQAFEQAWNDPAGFHTSDIAKQWFDLKGAGLPKVSVSFSPHATADVSLDRVADAIEQARDSVLFAVMEIGTAGGRVAEALRNLPKRDLYAFGTTQRLDGALQVMSPADPNSPFVPFDYLKSKVPPPFAAEVSGGAGQVIHHKFVVCDFNGQNPVAFAGSSNLAGGGEVDNGDNLVQFSEQDVATTFAVEAIQLIDHYRFRAVQQQATSDAPMKLKTRSEDWTKPYFDPSSPRCRERQLFVR